MATATTKADPTAIAAAAAVQNDQGHNRTL